MTQYTEQDTEDDAIAVYMNKLRQKCKYYMTPDGKRHEVKQEIFDRLAKTLYCYPQEIKEQKSLLAFAKYVPQNEYTYNYESDDTLSYGVGAIVQRYNNTHKENIITSLPEYKNFGLD